jgi:hypothetical protein
MGVKMVKQVTTLSITAIYLFIVLTHILLLPRGNSFSYIPRPSGNSIFKRKLENAATQAQTTNYNQRIDKSTVTKQLDIETLFFMMTLPILFLFHNRRGGVVLLHYRFAHLRGPFFLTPSIFSLRI